MPKVIFNGEPGDTYTNDTDRVMYQFEASLINTCGRCLQYHMAVASWWPIPLHRKCHCRQTLIRPGQASNPFVDFREVLRDLPYDQKQKAIGTANYQLLKDGAVKWDDVVTPSRVRTFREVASREKLSLKAMELAGVDKAVAKRAFESVNTPEHVLVKQHRKALVESLKTAGVSDRQIKQAFAERIAQRVTIEGGPSGRVPFPVKPTPLNVLIPVLRLDAATVVQAIAKPAEFKTAADIERWAKTVFPGAELEHEGIPVEVWREIADEMTFLARKYPEVAKELKYIGTKSGHWAKPGTQYAASADIHHGRTIAFNPEHWQSIEAVKSRNVLSQLREWHPAQIFDPRADVTHEWGHLVDAWIEKGNALTKDLTSAWRSLRNPFLETQNSVDQKVDPKKSVSRYGDTDHYEAVAEAFSALRWQPEHLWTEPLKTFKAALETAVNLVRKAVK